MTTLAPLPSVTEYVAGLNVTGTTDARKNNNETQQDYIKVGAGNSRERTCSIGFLADRYAAEYGRVPRNARRSPGTVIVLVRRQT